MTLARLVLALITTASILFSMQPKERELLKIYGQAYVEYRHHVPMLIPFLPRHLER